MLLGGHIKALLKAPHFWIEYYMSCKFCQLHIALDIEFMFTVMSSS